MQSTKQTKWNENEYVGEVRYIIDENIKSVLEEELNN